MRSRATAVATTRKSGLATASPTALLAELRALILATRQTVAQGVIAQADLIEGNGTEAKFPRG